MENGKMAAYCGLVCGDCGMYRKGRCGGCDSGNAMMKNCKVKACAIEKNFKTCAECSEYENLSDCKKLNNFVSKVFGFVFRTDRIGNLERIREGGKD